MLTIAYDPDAYDLVIFVEKPLVFIAFLVIFRVLTIAYDPYDLDVILMFFWHVFANQGFFLENHYFLIQIHHNVNFV